MKLPIPVICECGFVTLDAKKAVEHAEKHEREGKSQELQVSYFPKVEEGKCQKE